MSRAGYQRGRLALWRCLLSAFAIVSAVVTVHFLRWWGLALYVPIGLTIGYVDGALERRWTA